MARPRDVRQRREEADGSAGAGAGAGSGGTDAAIRAFIAIELDDAVRAAAAEVLRSLREGPGGDAVRWVPPENLHVTLRFLGDIPPAQVPVLAGALAEIAAGQSPFRLRLGRVAGFPSARRPRVISCEVGPRAPLEQLAEAVEQAVAKLGFEPEQRRFRPHLTLGRVRDRIRAHPPVTAPVTAAGEAQSVDAITLFRSRLGRSGATHTPLERISLGGSDHP
jgi:2'-5' RNA ligase